MIKRVVAGVEVFLFYSVVLIVIWGGRKLRPPAPVIALVVIGICIFSNLYHNDTKERIGLEWKNFWPNMKLILVFSAPLLIPLLGMAWINRYSGLWDNWFIFLGYPVWAFAQEYTLLGFIGNRLEDVLPNNPLLVPWINGFLFGMAHLPNPVLMTLTFIAGVIFTYVFFRHRQLLPIALVHALFGVGISLAFGAINGIMSVGPGYIARIGTLRMPY